ncbi:NAD(P)H-hydrate dehydratase [Pontixanthobacter aquaemixtae]|uniref:Bifunctional NAD(P)H-hydrate repair enzyme n=1 Tax=Pontixanthobacter aquaemixtae TaxID=1958940 RepID=A0A844ZRP3_9SPHN|nr:NAD(P)H-hydrate dehydratase [Pontixanthobacter aquaemixtae]MXO90408.1 NAD(P)H-hydrate dehydratase [Pontixanthobacter aquaemixtae]
MTRPNDLILTAVQMQAAEQALIDAGSSVEELMQIAGKGAAEWVWRMASGRPVTVLCGPGNNGGDGYVIAEVLRRRGLAVKVVAPKQPATKAAQSAREAFQGNISEDGAKISGSVFVDCLFGTGLSRPLSSELVSLLAGLAAQHDFSIAVDLPSGVDADNGAVLSPVPDFDLTLALGAWKWGHWMLPAATQLGERRLVEIGIDASAQRDFVTGAVLQKPALKVPDTDAHKYSRGLVAIVAGEMTGAAKLAAKAAMSAGAGYVKILSDGRDIETPSDLVVDARPLGEALSDERIASILIGPGLGTGEVACGRLRAVFGMERAVPTVLDADALNLIGAVEWPGPSERPYLLTPHGGEVARLRSVFEPPAKKPPLPDKVHQAIELDWMTDATIVAKGPDTVIFNRDAGLAVSPAASSWLSTAGTGDVLAGIAASRLATGEQPFDAACQAVWLHGEAARLAGPAFSASRLAGKVADAYAACL